MKNQSKIRYILSVLLAVVVLGFVGGIAAVVFGEIGKINIGPADTSTLLVNPHLVVKGYGDTENPNKLLDW